MRRTRIKVCCMASVAEAAVAVAAGADALGLVGPMPSGPGPITLELAHAIARATPPGVDSVLLTSKLTAAELVAEIAAVQPTVVQLVDAVEAGAHAALRTAFPALRQLQVIHVENASAVEQARALEDVVDGFLLDSGRPSLAIKELGGTGRVHDWTVSAELVRSVRRPVFLAGGLNPANVQAAIRAVRPFGVDLCSGVRTDGALDPAKLDAFVAGVAAA